MRPNGTGQLQNGMACVSQGRGAKTVCLQLHRDHLDRDFSSIVLQYAKSIHTHLLPIRLTRITKKRTICELPHQALQTYQRPTHPYSTSGAQPMPLRPQTLHTHYTSPPPKPTRPQTNGANSANSANSTNGLSHPMTCSRRGGWVARQAASPRSSGEADFSRLYHFSARV